jgi:hypothetical protein
VEPIHIHIYSPSSTQIRALAHLRTPPHSPPQIEDPRHGVDPNVPTRQVWQLPQMRTEARRRPSPRPSSTPPSALPPSEPFTQTPRPSLSLSLSHSLCLPLFYAASVGLLEDMKIIGRTPRSACMLGLGGVCCGDGVFTAPDVRLCLLWSSSDSPLLRMMDSMDFSPRSTEKSAVS